MGAETGIQWADSTFNPWWGCVEVSAGCDNCYARVFAERMGSNVWGAARHTPRRELSAGYWKHPLQWNRLAQQQGRRRSVFPSMCDPFEAHPQLDPIRERFWDLIDSTRWLLWLLLTKRPHNIQRMIPQHWREHPPENVLYGTSVEGNATAAQRVPHLMNVPAVGRFLSMEPLLEPVTLPDWAWNGLDWVIIGGESGRFARPFQLEWARAILDEARAVSTPPRLFMKQVGSDPYGTGLGRLGYKDKKGGDPTEWPPDLQVRELLPLRFYVPHPEGP